MKLLLMTLLIAMNFNTAFAGDMLSNEECIRVYRDGYTELSEMVEMYNDQNINRFEFSAMVTANSSEIGLHRMACSFSETPDADVCVKKYKKLYKTLRDRIKLSSVMMGNQPKISYTEESFSIATKKEVQKETLWGKITKGWRHAKEEGEVARQIGALAFIDMKCGR